MRESTLRARIPRRQIAADTAYTMAAQNVDSLSGIIEMLVKCPAAVALLISPDGNFERAI
jgi:hypothetical protein